jgi:hypothetical protein
MTKGATYEPLSAASEFVSATAHYKQWYKLVVGEGYRVGGKNPAATFLTRVARVETVERVGRRSGLYRLRAAA